MIHIIFVLLEKGVYRTIGCKKNAYFFCPLPVALMVSSAAPGRGDDWWVFSSVFVPAGRKTGGLGWVSLCCAEFVHYIRYVRTLSIFGWYCT